jgi:hypothetical protein
MMADPIVINASDVTTIASGATSGLDVTLQGINIVWQGAYYNPDGSGSIDLRVYANKSMTLTAESNISKLEIAGYCKAGLTVTADAGTITTGASYASETTKGTLEDPLIVVDEIGATSVTLTCTKQMRAYTIRVTLEEGGVTPPPADTYTVAGNDAAIFGESWNPALAANDMTLANGIYKWEKANLNLTAGTIQFKVVKNHSWDIAYPAQNYELSIAEEGEYTLTITFDPSNEAVAAEAVKKEALADPTNCAEAAAAALSVSANNELYNNGAVYTIEGYVTGIKTAYSDQYHNISFWMADAADGGEVLQAFRAACASEADAPKVGDKVAVTGSLTKYGTTPEFAAGCTYVITERAEVVDPVNLGEKTIAEFLELANTKDTCILTGVIADVVNAQYGNFYLVEGTDSLYVYGLKDAAGAYCFETESLAEGDTLKVLAIYSTYNNKPQAKNAIFVEVKKAVVVEHTYTVAGMESVFGTNWTPSDANNDMTKQEDGTYKWEKANLELAAGNVEFKVCEDHAWTVAYPAQNYVLAIEEAGIYTITITFDPANDNAVNAVATKTGSAEIDPVVSIAGSMNSWNASANVMTLAEDKATATLALNLEAQTYDFKVVLNGGEWRSNAQEFTRENASATEMTGNEDNMHLVADVAGEYVFTWTFADNSLAITYPEAPVVPETITIDIESEVQYKDYVAEAGWWQFMAENDEYEISISNLSTTQAAGVYTVADLDAKYTYVFIKADSTKVHFVDGEFTLTEGEDGSRTIEGVMTGDDNNIYNIKLVFVIPTAETTVNVEIPEWGVADAAEYYDLTGTIFYGEAADGTYIQFTVLGNNPIGTFTYDDLYLAGIEVAGKYKPIYSMNVTVNATQQMRPIITADILCLNNTLYHVTTTIGQGIEDIDAAVEAIKRIVNGQLVIEKAGKTYNVNGAVIR